MMIYEPTEAEIFHYGGARHSHLYNRAAPSLSGAATGGLRRGLAARISGMGGSGDGGIENPYDFGDGSLIGMWMPMWNVGVGIQDLTYDGCVDLSGNGHDMTFVGNHSLSSNAMYISGNSNSAYGMIDGISFGSDVTEDMCCNVIGNTQWGRFVAESRGITFTSNVYQIGNLYGWGRDTVITNENILITRGNIFSHAFTISGNISCYYYNGFRNSNSLTITPTTYSGKTTLFNRTNGGRGIDGYLHRVCFYNRPLNEAEVQRNHRKDAELFGFTL